jgi:hypothetical protein
VVADRLVLDAEEVFLRSARSAAVAQCLEVLLGTAGDARFLERVADEGAAAAGGGADEIRAIGLPSVHHKFLTIFINKLVNKGRSIT